MIPPYPDSFDYEPVSPFTVLLINDPLEPQVKRKRSLGRAVVWMYLHLLDDCPFAAIVDATGTMIYCAQPLHVTAVAEVFSVMEQLGGPLGQLVVAEMEPHARVRWPEKTGG